MRKQNTNNVEEKRSRKLISQYAPPEIWSPVLVNLPVKSLLRFRNNVGEAYNLAQMNLDKAIVALSTDTLRETSQFSFPVKVGFFFNIEAYISGMVLIADPFDDPMMVLWNSSIRKCSTLPPCQALDNWRHVVEVYWLNSNRWRRLSCQIPTYLVLSASSRKSYIGLQEKARIFLKSDWDRQIASFDVYTEFLVAKLCQQKATIEVR